MESREEKKKRERAITSRSSPMRTERSQRDKAERSKRKRGECVFVSE